jgi:hypothetical protein
MPVRQPSARPEDVMNIFVLDLDIPTCAAYHADQHVIKMVLESAQMLCTVLSRHGIATPYKPTHAAHPCTLWAGAAMANWIWLRDLALRLDDEYRYRFERERSHRSATVIRALPDPPLSDLGLTPFAQAMPEIYRVPGDAVAAYRAYYIGEKASFATWTRRPRPPWFPEPVPG